MVWFGTFVSNPSLPGAHLVFPAIASEDLQGEPARAFGRPGPPEVSGAGVDGEAEGGAEEDDQRRPKQDSRTRWLLSRVLTRPCSGPRPLQFKLDRARMNPMHVDRKGDRIGQKGTDAERCKVGFSI